MSAGIRAGASNDAYIQVNGADIVKIDATGAVTQKPPASAVPANNGDMVIQLTSNTSLTFRVKGSDGVVRQGSITLA